MRPTDKIESLIKNASIRTGTENDRKVLNEVLDAFEESKLKQAGASQLNIWRIIMKSKMTKLAAAAVIVIAGIMGVHLLNGTNAYAKVVEEIRNARTLVYTLITQSNTGNGETIKTDMAFKEPGYLRTSTIKGYICIVDATTGKVMSIVPGQGYTLGDIKNMANTGGPGPFESIESMKKLPDKADNSLGEKEIDGINCDGYEVTQGDLTTLVWIDTKNGEVIQVEQKFANAPGMNRIIKNIKFDVDLDDSLFSLEPPAGYKSMGVELKSDTAAQTEQTFVDWLRWWANGNIDETFPPMVAGAEIAKVTMDMAKQGKLKGEYWKNVDPSKMYNALIFVGTLPQNSNWRYAGNSVKINTPDTPIFWYRPAGSQMYRVIYADLTVREMAENQLPK